MPRSPGRSRDTPLARSRDRPVAPLGAPRSPRRWFTATAIGGAIGLIGAAAGCAAGPAGPAHAVGAGAGPGATADCPTGSVVLSSQADVARLAQCTTLSGVAVRSAARLDLSALRQLAVITGDLVIGPSVAVDELALGQLRSVTGAVHAVANGVLRGVFLPRLERAGRIEIDGNPALATVSLPRLSEIHGALRITDNASLELVDLSSLVSIDQALVVTGDPVLSLIDADQLRRAASVELAAPKLPAELAAALSATAPAPAR